ncbi:MAG: ATP-binding cassette domain-containing protein [Candidatus Eisenbacteria bacterium]|nr:ATP-binding cassette domain-containing protein [Candidatus Eisenbacteria bacterium]
MPDPVLEAVNVEKTFPNGIVAVDDVSLSVGEGETVVLIGESGCGKTTLLRHFNRLEEPTSGEIRIEGEQAGRIDPIELRRRTGYVQQEGGLLPHWTVARNVALVPRLLGWDGDRIEKRVRELLDLVGLDYQRYKDSYPAHLSGGQRQRVAFARALAADPHVILMDEPFGALDALTRLEMQDEFLKLKERLKKTMLLVTHDLDEGVRLADRLAIMKDGRLHQVAAPQELIENPATDYVASLLKLRSGDGQ